MKELSHQVELKISPRLEARIAYLAGSCRGREILEAEDLFDRIQQELRRTEQVIAHILDTAETAIVLAIEEEQAVETHRK